MTDGYAFVTTFDADGNRVQINGTSTRLVPAGLEVQVSVPGIHTILVTSVKIVCEPTRRADATTHIFVSSPVTFYDRAAARAPAMPAGCIHLRAPLFQPRKRVELVQPTDTLQQDQFNCLGTDDVDVSDGWGLLCDTNAVGDGDAMYLSTIVNNYVVRALWLAKISPASGTDWRTLNASDKRCIAAWTLQGAGVLYCDGGKQILDTRGLPDETFGIRKDCDGVAAAGACLFAAIKAYHNKFVYAPTPLGRMVKEVVSFLVNSFAEAGVAFVMAVSPGSQATNHTSRAIHECEMHKACVKPFGHAVLVLLGPEPLIAEMTAPVAPVGITAADVSAVAVMTDVDYNNAAKEFRSALHARGYAHGSFYRGREWQPYFYQSLEVLYTGTRMIARTQPMDESVDTLHEFLRELSPEVKASPDPTTHSLNHAYRRVPGGTVPPRMAPAVLHTLPELGLDNKVLFAVQVSPSDTRSTTAIDALNRLITTEQSPGPK